MYAIRSYYGNSEGTGTSGPAKRPVPLARQPAPAATPEVPGRVAAEKDSAAQVVITSYSIHYTKLYES